MNKLKLYLCYGGYCQAPCRITQGNNILCEYKKENIHVFFFYIEYNNLKILFDTGYDNTCFHAKSCNTIHDKLFNDSDIDYVIISHYHFDHIANIKKYINVKFIAIDKPNKSFNSGFIDILLSNFYDKLHIVKLNSKYLNFHSHDMFNDGKIIIDGLNGHTMEQC
jgi:metal-dependent hydrolase (beta-lactamase superfamily II)